MSMSVSSTGRTSPDTSAEAWAAQTISETYRDSLTAEYAAKWNATPDGASHD
jgi:hypothetical protein